MRLPLLESISPAPAHFESGPRSIGAVRVLRISVTDRCNFRCVYCMPADGVKWLPQAEILSFEEIADIVRAAVDVHGIRRFKLTGGEPTVRHGLVDLVAMLRKIRGVDDLSLTTNGFALETMANPLREAGLDRITVSLDSLKPDRFKQITRTGDLATVLRGLHRTIDVGFRSIKINCVTMRGTNDDEVADFANLARTLPVSVRFIEYMPLGDSQLLAAGNPFEAQTDDAGTVSYTTGGPGLLGPVAQLQQAGAAGGMRVAAEETGPAGGCGGQARGDVFLPESFVHAEIEAAHGPLLPIDREAEAGVGPAVPYGFANHPDAPGRVGFISAMSAPFCSTCNRLRLTATGVLRSCLFEGGEVDLKPILRVNSGTGIPAGVRAPPEASSDGPLDTDKHVFVTEESRRHAIARAMTDCVRLKPDVHGVRGNEQMSRLGG